MEELACSGDVIHIGRGGLNRVDQDGLVDYSLALCFREADLLQQQRQRFT
jgi:hypothetical protein